MMRILTIVILTVGVTGCASLPAPDPNFSLQVFEPPDDMEWILNGSRAYTSVVSRCAVVFDQHSIVATDPISKGGDIVAFTCALTPAGIDEFWKCARRPCHREMILCVNGQVQESLIGICPGCRVLEGSLPGPTFEYVSSQLRAIHRGEKGIQPRTQRDAATRAR